MESSNTAVNVTNSFILSAYAEGRISVEAILLIGIPGFGKCSFYKERFYTTHLHINRDMLKTNVANAP